jgi:hypothetical protein
LAAGAGRRFGWRREGGSEGMRSNRVRVTEP